MCRYLHINTFLNQCSVPPWTFLCYKKQWNYLFLKNEIFFDMKILQEVSPQRGPSQVWTHGPRAVRQRCRPCSLNTSFQFNLRACETAIVSMVTKTHSDFNRKMLFRFCCDERKSANVMSYHNKRTSFSVSSSSGGAPPADWLPLPCSLGGSSCYVLSSPLSQSTPCTPPPLFFFFGRWFCF